MKIEITKPNPKLSAFRFVVAAVAKESSRYAIGFIKIEEGCMVATDGHRLYAAHFNHDYELGLYEVIKNTRSKVILLKTDEAVTFPKWQDIIPPHDHYFDSSCDSGYWVDRTMGILSRLGIGINSDYIGPLCEASINWNVYCGEFDQPVHAVFQSAEIKFRAVIMPVNMAFGDVQVRRRIVSNIYVQPETA